MKNAIPVRESDIQKAIIQWLRLQGAWTVRVNGGAVKTEKRFIRFTDTVGTPDILCCWPLPGEGRSVFLGIECKRPSGKLRPEQAAVIDAIRKAGGLAFVATSLKDVEDALKIEGLV